MEATTTTTKIYRVMWLRVLADWFEEDTDPARAACFGFVFVDIEKGRSLAELQRMVDGYIEAVDCRGRVGVERLDFYANENGIAEGKPHNVPASLIAGQPIVGDVVFAAGVDSEGDMVGLTPEEEAKLRSFCLACGFAKLDETGMHFRN